MSESTPFKFNHETAVRGSYCQFVLTHECNKHCPFCIDQYRGRNEFMSRDTLTEIAIPAAREYTASHVGEKAILLLGGEPTLHPDIVEFAQLIKDAGFRTLMTTNYTRPDVVQSLDGVLDGINISYYRQKELPHKDDFLTSLTLSALIRKLQLDTKEKIDTFFDKYDLQFDDIRLATMIACNGWSRRMQDKEVIGARLDQIEPAERVTVFDECEAIIYRNHYIVRYDRPLVGRTVDVGFRKVQVDGEVTEGWERALPETVNL
jgi:organic radical activating enzyme